MRPRTHTRPSGAEVRHSARVRRIVPIMAVLLVALAGSLAIAAKNRPTEIEIVTAIEREMLLDPVVPFDSIDIHIEDGIVTLQGTVDNVLAKQRAARLAETVREVRGVVNLIEVQLDEPRRVDELERDVELALLGDPATDSYEIDVEATPRGLVTLEGTVESFQERSLSETVAMGVRGVTNVDNRIEIDYQANRSDREIEPEIERRLRWDALVDHGLIDVAVKEGVVTLSGTVGSAAEKRRATADAWVAGVRRVEVTDLEVARWARDPDLRTRKYEPKPDLEIEQAIEDALLYDPRVLSFEVVSHVDNGIATLHGTVDNPEARRAAAKDAGSVVGVKAVRNHIKVRPDDRPSDATITTRVENALERDPLVADAAVDVTVARGVVYLDGSVQDVFDRARAETVANRTRGVVAVANRLQIDEPVRMRSAGDPARPWWPWYLTPIPSAPFSTDDAIAASIESEIWWSPFVDLDEITVSVEDGTATLRGQVDSMMELRAATENAWEGGAIAVRNELIVR